MYEQELEFDQEAYENYELNEVFGDAISQIKQRLLLKIKKDIQAEHEYVKSENAELKKTRDDLIKANRDVKNQLAEAQLENRKLQEKLEKVSIQDILKNSLSAYYVVNYEPTFKLVEYTLPSGAVDKERILDHIRYFVEDLDLISLIIHKEEKKAHFKYYSPVNAYNEIEFIMVEKRIYKSAEEAINELENIRKTKASSSHLDGRYMYFESKEEAQKLAEYAQERYNKEKENEKTA